MSAKEGAQEGDDDEEERVVNGEERDVAQAQRDAAANERARMSFHWQQALVERNESRARVATLERDQAEIMGHLRAITAERDQARGELQQERGTTLICLRCRHCRAVWNATREHFARDLIAAEKALYAAALTYGRSVVAHLKARVDDMTDAEIQVGAAEYVARIALEDAAKTPTTSRAG